MQIRWLGWAGLELEVQGSTLVIDPLADAGAVFAPFGARAEDVPLPAVHAAQPGLAVAGLLTHLHRDHADAGALRAALAEGAPVLEPQRVPGGPTDDLAMLQAEHELQAAGLHRRRVVAWERFELPPFTVTALPAVDGLGDPQVSWLVEAEGRRVLHLGDTMHHGWFWRFVQRFGPIDVVLLPVNGAVVDFPHRQPASPLPVAMTPEQAVAAARVLGAGLAVPIHADGYELRGAYEPSPAAAEAFIVAAVRLGCPAVLPELGRPLSLP